MDADNKREIEAKKPDPNHEHELAMSWRGDMVAKGVGFTINTIDDAWFAARQLHLAGFHAKNNNSVQKCFLAILLGQQVGANPFMAVNKICVINGQASVWGDLALSLAIKSGLTEDIIETMEGEGDDFGATCTVKLKDRPTPVVRRFTVSDAKGAGLFTKEGTWRQYPKRMLQMRARGFALRDAVPHVLSGMYLVEEASDIIDVDATSRPAGPVDLDTVKSGERVRFGFTDKPPYEPVTTEPPEDTVRRMRGHQDQASPEPSNGNDVDDPLTDKDLAELQTAAAATENNLPQQEPEAPAPSASVQQADSDADLVRDHFTIGETNRLKSALAQLSPVAVQDVCQLFKCNSQTDLYLIIATCDDVVLLRQAAELAESLADVTV